MVPFISFACVKSIKNLSHDLCIFNSLINSLTSSVKFVDLQKSALISPVHMRSSKLLLLIVSRIEIRVVERSDSDTSEFCESCGKYELITRSFLFSLSMIMPSMKLAKHLLFGF